MTLAVETYDLTESPHDDRGKRWPPVVVERHFGPGDHPSGSPQDVHAGDDDLSWVDGLADRLETEQGRREFRERMEPYIQEAIERARSGISEEFGVRFAERIEPAAFVNNVGDFLVAPNGEMFNILSNDHDEMVDEILQDVPWKIVSSVADIGTLKKLSLTLGFVRGRSFTPDRDNPNERNLHGELMLEAEPPISSSAKRSMRDVMAVMPEDTSFIFEVNARRDTNFEVFYNVDDIEAYLRRSELDERHLGPGDHPSGSPQDAHAGDGGRDFADYDMDELRERLRHPSKQTRARIILSEHYGDVSLSDAHNAAWIAPNGVLTSDLADHQASAQIIADALDLEYQDDNDAVQLMKAMGFVRFYSADRAGQGELNFDAELPLTRQQKSTIQDLTEAYPEAETAFEFNQPRYWHQDRESHFFTRDEREAFGVAGIIERHLGPGDHPSGSSQDAHAGDDASATRELVAQAHENLQSLVASPLDVVEFPAEEFFIGPNGDIYLANELWMGHEQIAEMALEGILGEVTKLVRERAEKYDEIYTLSPVGKLMRGLGFVRGHAATDEWAFDLAQKPTRSQIKTIDDLGQIASSEEVLFWTMDLPGEEPEDGYGDFPDLMRRIGVFRHLGPGDHPSGSPQDAHAGDDGASVREIATRVLKDEWDVVDNVFEIEPGFNGWVLPDGTVIDIHNETHLNSLEQLRYHVKGWDNEPQIRMFDALMENGFVRTGVVWGDTPRLFIQMDSYPTREAREAIDSLMSAFQDGHFTWELLDRGQSGTDRHEFRRLSGVRVDRSFIAQAAYALDQALGDLERLLTGRHYGPGPHPGTGTDQEVHGDGRGRSRVRQLADAVKDRYEVIDNLAELPSHMNAFILPDGAVINLRGKEHHGSLQEINDEIGLWDDDRFGRKVYDAAFDGGFVRMSFVRWGTGHPSFMLQLRPDPPQPVKDTIRDLFAIYGEDSDLVFDVLDVDSGTSLREFEQVSGVNVTRHYGPGHHPGTGTDQEVHGGNGSGSEHIQRFPDDTETYRDLIDRMSAMHREGKFALVTRDQETGEYLMITDRETAIDKLGEDIRDNPSETFYAFNGVEMFFHRQGGKHNVNFDAYELADMRGFAEEAHQFGNEVATIHNHPPRLGEFMPPSPSDLEMSAAIHADELRVYTGDGTYKVRFEKFGNSAAFEIKMAFDDYDGENYHDRFPEFSSLYPEQQENYIRNTGKADELRQYQLDRLDHVADTLDWVSYEFQPLDD